MGRVNENKARVSVLNSGIKLDSYSGCGINSPFGDQSRRCRANYAGSSVQVACFDFGSFSAVSLRAVGHVGCPPRFASSTPSLSSCPWQHSSGSVAVLRTGYFKAS